MSSLTLERLNKFDTLEFPSHSLIDYYDSIHQLLEAITALQGVKIKGEGAHRELINYVALSEGERRFLQNLREKRNKIAYEGFNITKEWLENNEEKIIAVIKKLQSIL